MTFDEFKQKITTIMAQPDTAPAEIPALLDAVKGDYEVALSTVQKLAEAEDRIRTLQDTNHRLFLAQTGQPAPESEPELEGHAAVDAFVAELMSKN